MTDTANKPNTESDTDQHGGGVDRKFPHMYEAGGGNGHFDGKFVSTERSSRHSDDDFSAGVGFSTLGHVNVQTGLEYEELSIGTLAHLTPDQARAFAGSLIEAADHVEENYE